ncbi:MAG: hypothetical protein CVU14_05555 [Bacteroidetes bacterium HGW-Bacteroidetes-9]|nr:MAG: hypothetical protein CVU14_05555 [Bacteroidetes bacterium HGW-Bacteroidetes-9]
MLSGFVEASKLKIIISLEASATINFFFNIFSTIPLTSKNTANDCEIRHIHAENYIYILFKIAGNCG